jgi:hypothetical protein
MSLVLHNPTTDRDYRIASIDVLSNLTGNLFREILQYLIIIITNNFEFIRRRVPNYLLIRGLTLFRFLVVTRRISISIFKCIFQREYLIELRLIISRGPTVWLFILLSIVPEILLPLFFLSLMHLGIETNRIKKFFELYIIKYPLYIQGHMILNPLQQASFDCRLLW